MVSSSPAKGMTLVELLVAVSVMVLLGVLIVPRLRAISDDNRIHEAARLVSAQISKGAKQAVARSHAKRTPKSDDVELPENSPPIGTLVVFHRNDNMSQQGAVFGTTTIQHGFSEVEHSPCGVFVRANLAVEKTELPPGTVLDWRFSGSNFDTELFDHFVNNRHYIGLMFDEFGIPSAIVPIDEKLRLLRPIVISGSTRFLVRGYRDYDQTFAAGDPVVGQLEIARNVLNQEDSLWVVSSGTSGRTSTKPLVPPTSKDCIQKMLVEATALTRVQ